MKKMKTQKIKTKKENKTNLFDNENINIYPINDKIVIIRDENYDEIISPKGKYELGTYDLFDEYVVFCEKNNEYFLERQYHLFAELEQIDKDDFLSRSAESGFAKDLAYDGFLEDLVVNYYDYNFKYIFDEIVDYYFEEIEGNYDEAKTIAKKDIIKILKKNNKLSKQLEKEISQF